MDFSYTQEQRDLRELARKMLDELAPVEKLPAYDEPQDWMNEKLWTEFAKAGLLGVGLQEDVGGLGGGIVELSILLEELGRSCMPVPALPALVMGAGTVDRFGNDEQRRRLLPQVIAGELLLTAAVTEAASRDPRTPTVRADRDGSGWKLEGTKDFVPAAGLAGVVLVSARTGTDEVGIFLVDPGSAGVSLEAQAGTTGELEYRMTLIGVAVDENQVLAVGARGREALDWLVDHTLAGLCAAELGVADQAVRMTARYTSERKQFGKPIAEFQAVAQRAGDAYIDVDAIRLVTAQAVWRLAEGLPARRELSIAKFWAAEGGHRACYAAQHLHGGIGVDTDYPLHHFYLASRRIELTLGGANSHLDLLGARLASDQWSPAG